MLKYQPHPYHLVEASPWPLAASMALFITTLSGVMSFHGYVNGGVFLAIGIIATVSTMSLWFRDILREGTFLGHHTAAVQKGLMTGFILFVVSECFFFLSIFWAFGHSGLAPTVELGCSWPPAGIKSINPFELPLLNTILLLSSGATVTWSHHSLISGDRRSAISGLIVTLILALIFTGVQAYEYYNAPFTISDGVFGSVFYMATGFHGAHVIIGSIMLAVSLYRLVNYHFTNFHHVGLETAILYWHFVDLVWLALFVFVYVWGSDHSDHSISSSSMASSTIAASSFASSSSSKISPILAPQGNRECYSYHSKLAILSPFRLY
jgi:cytochrome c oxidase subunit 3